MLDRDGYPDDESLELIKNFKVKKGNLKDLISLVYGNWWSADWGFSANKYKRNIVVKLHTGGWSGNEDVIYSLRRTQDFWVYFCDIQQTGGHYTFRIPLDWWEDKKEQQLKELQRRVEGVE